MSHKIANFFHYIGFGDTKKAEHTGGERTQHTTVKHNNQANTHQMRAQVSQQTSLASSAITTHNYKEGFSPKDIERMEAKISSSQIDKLFNEIEEYDAAISKEADKQFNEIEEYDAAISKEADEQFKKLDSTDVALDGTGLSQEDFDILDIDDLASISEDPLNDISISFPDPQELKSEVNEAQAELIRMDPEEEKLFRRIKQHSQIDLEVKNLNDMFSICKDKAKLRDLIKDAISLHVVPDDNAAIDSTDSLKKDGAEYNVQLITDKQEVTVQCKNIHGTIRFVKILEEHKRLDLSGIAEINGQEQKTTELQGHLDQILATNKKFDEHLHEGLDEEDMSDLLDQLDQDIAKDETADLPDVPFNANDLPDVPNTPVNSESSIAENSQPKVKRRVAETE